MHSLWLIARYEYRRIAGHRSFVISTLALPVLIVGLMAGYFSYGVVSMLVFFRSPEELRTYHLWTLGSFSGVTWRDLPIIASVTLGGCALITLRFRMLDILHMGDSFAHTVGEFGVVLMLGGNIPGVTRVISVQIYDHVEALEYTQAHWLAGGMVVFSFIVLLGLNLTRRARLLP